MDGNTKEVILAALGPFSGIVGGAVGAYLANRAAEKREATERVFRTQQEAVRQVRDSRARFGPEKLEAFRSAHVALAALMRESDKYLEQAAEDRTWRGHAQFEATQATLRDFSFLFPLSVQKYGLEALHAVVVPAQLVESGVARDDSRIAEAMATRDKALREFEVITRAELGIEPTIEPPPRLQRSF